MFRHRFPSALAMAGLAAILLPSLLPAQITFQRTYDGLLDESGESVQQTTDGGYIICGSTTNIVVESYVYVIKTNSQGDTMWTKTFGSGGGDYSYSAQQTSDAGYIIAGVTESLGAGGWDMRLIKTDSRGDTLWTKTYGGTSADFGLSAQQTTDGGYVVAGYTGSFGSGSFDFYLVKTSASGDTLWTKTYGDTSDDRGRSVQQTADGGYIVGGYTKSFDTASRDVYLVKTDAQGDTEWTRTYGGTEPDEAGSVRQTADSGFIVVGTTYSWARVWDIYLVKTNPRGDTQWTKTYGGADTDWGYSVQQTADSGFIITGYTHSFGAGGADVYLIKTNASGDTLWTRTFGDTGSDIGYSVQQTMDGGYVVVGRTYRVGAANFDVYLIKTDANGNVAVAEPKTGPTRVPALSLSCEPNPCRGATRISLTPQAASSKPLTLRMYDMVCPRFAGHFLKRQVLVPRTQPG